MTLRLSAADAQRFGIVPVRVGRDKASDSEPRPRGKHRNQHTELVKACLELLGLLGIFAWPQKTTGTYDPARQRFRTFHGRKGVSDIGAMAPGTPEGRAGVYIAVEVKTGTGRPSKDQLEFLSQVNRNGGIGAIVRSLDDLRAVLKSELSIG